MKAKQILSNINRSLYRRATTLNNVTIWLNSRPFVVNNKEFIPSFDPIFYVFNTNAIKNIKYYTSYCAHTSKAKAYREVLERLADDPSVDYEVVGYGPK